MGFLPICCSLSKRISNLTNYGNFRENKALRNLNEIFLFNKILILNETLCRLANGNTKGFFSFCLIIGRARINKTTRFRLLENYNGAQRNQCSTEKSKNLLTLTNALQQYMLRSLVKITVGHLAFDKDCPPAASVDVPNDLIEL